MHSNPKTKLRKRHARKTFVYSSLYVLYRKYDVVIFIYISYRAQMARFYHARCICVCVHTRVHSTLNLARVRTTCTHGTTRSPGRVSMVDNLQPLVV
jgi:hypothetical protein